MFWEIDVNYQFPLIGDKTYLGKAYPYLSMYHTIEKKITPPRDAIGLPVRRYGARGAKSSVG